jgi:hypothetical protein
MKMNVDLKSDSSHGVGVDLFNHSSDEDEDDDDGDGDGDDDDDGDGDDDGDEDDDEEEEDEDNDEEDQEGNDDDSDNEEDDNEVENRVHNSIGCNMLDVTPRDVHINHSSSTIHMSRIHWPPGSWQDGTRRSAFQPYRVGSTLIDTDDKIRDLFASDLLTLR